MAVKKESKSSKSPKSAGMYLKREAGQAMNPKTIVTGYYGARGEKMRYTVQDGALRIPSSALEMIQIQLNQTASVGVSTSKKYTLPGLDVAIRPSVDPVLLESGVSLTELSSQLHTPPPRIDPVTGQLLHFQPTTKTVASNVKLPIPALKTDESERIRGGGETQGIGDQGPQPQQQTGIQSVAHESDAMSNVGLPSLPASHTSAATEADPNPSDSGATIASRAPIPVPHTQPSRSTPADTGLVAGQGVAAVGTAALTVSALQSNEETSRNATDAVNTSSQGMLLMQKPSGTTVEASSSKPAEPQVANPLSSSLSTTSSAIQQGLDSGTNSAIVAAQSVPRSAIHPVSSLPLTMHTDVQSTTSLPVVATPQLPHASGINLPVAHTKSDSNVVAVGANTMSATMPKNKGGESTSSAGQSTVSITGKPGAVFASAQEAPSAVTGISSSEAMAPAAPAQSVSQAVAAVPPAQPPTISGLPIAAPLAATTQSLPSGAAVKTTPVVSVSQTLSATVPSSAATTQAPQTTTQVSSTPVPTMTQSITSATASTLSQVESTHSASASAASTSVAGVAVGLISSSDTEVGTNQSIDTAMVPTQSVSVASATTGTNEATATTEASKNEEDISKGSPRIMSLEKTLAPQYEQHTPSANDEMQVEIKVERPSWYKAGEASDLERTLLPEWFNQSASHRTEESYVKTREAIMKMSTKIGNRFVTKTLVRRTLAGDIGSLHRLHDFLVGYSLINADAINDSTPSHPQLREVLKEPKAFPWTTTTRDLLTEAVVKVALIPEDGGEGVEVDWTEVARRVSRGVSSSDCEREFLNLTNLQTTEPVERSITPDAMDVDKPKGNSGSESAKKRKRETEASSFLQDLLSRAKPEVVRATLEKSLAQSSSLAEAQGNAIASLTIGAAVESAREEEDALARSLAELHEQRLSKLENRMAMLDDIECLLETERVALELERRDLYTARCRHWFGSGS